VATRAAAPAGLSSGAAIHFDQRGLDQLVHQVVGFDAEALAPGNLDVRPLCASSSESSMPRSAQQRGESATIS
jgi:hypothetical protein